MDLYQTIQRTLQDAVDDIKRRSTQAGQVATGRTLRALEVRMKAEGQEIIGQIWGRPFTGALETGSRPASKASHNPKLTQKVMAVNLAQWMRVRGLSSDLTDKQLKQAAEHLAWYIRRYGSKLYREGGRRDIITPAIESTKKVLVERLGMDFENLFFNQLK